MVPDAVVCLIYYSSISTWPRSATAASMSTSVSRRTHEPYLSWHRSTVCHHSARGSFLRSIRGCRMKQSFEDVRINECSFHEFRQTSHEFFVLQVLDRKLLIDDIVPGRAE